MIQNMFCYQVIWYAGIAYSENNLALHILPFQRYPSM